MARLDPLFPDDDDNKRIHPFDYNTIRNKILQVLGNGSGTFGYGQQLLSSPVSSGNLIEAAQWDNLRKDLINIRWHQNGVQPSITPVVSGSVIRFRDSEPNRRYDILAEEVLTTRFNIGTGRSIVLDGATQSRTGSWSTQSQCEATVTFTTSDNARYFFNSGGRIRISSSRTGGAPTSQNNAWTNILNSVGTIEFAGNITNERNFYNLTDEYVSFFNRSLSTPYSSNFYQIEVKSNVVNNSTGLANVVNFRITWRDDYIDPGNNPGDNPNTDDIVDGTLTVILEEFKAAGPMIPDGNFQIESPNYVIGSITAS
jgi:hypothetical protein